MATTVIVNKKWAGDEATIQNRPTSVEVILLRNSQEYERQTLTADTGWTHTWTNLSYYYTWTVREGTQLENYQATYEEKSSGSTWNRTETFDITNTYVAPPEPTLIDVSASVRFNNDLDYRYLRPIYVELTLKKDGQFYDSVRIGEGFAWNWVWSGLDKNSVWTIESETLPHYKVNVSQIGTDFQFLYSCTYVPPTPPDPSPGNHPTKGDYDLMYSVLYDDISVQNAKDIIHILDYGKV